MCDIWNILQLCVVSGTLDDAHRGDSPPQKKNKRRKKRKFNLSLFSQKCKLRPQKSFRSHSDFIKNLFAPEPLRNSFVFFLWLLTPDKYTYLQWAKKSLLEHKLSAFEINVYLYRWNIDLASLNIHTAKYSYLLDLKVYELGLKPKYIIYQYFFSRD